jgi:hypothetical protein
MAPPKPRNAVFKDSVVALLALKAHFAICDNHPKERTLLELAKLMLHHVPNAPQGAPNWAGEYYEACNNFATTHEDEMRQNMCTIDNLLKGNQTGYFTGESLWRKAQDCKRIMINEIHSVFCQEVCPRWPNLPPGITSLDPLMLQLRKLLWIKKAQELKEVRVQRAETKMQDAKKANEAAAQEEGILSATALTTSALVDVAAKELENVKAEELLEFDPEWYPTVWRAYIAFGPSLDDPHGHGGFLSPKNGPSVASASQLPGSLPPTTADQAQMSGRKKAKDDARPKAGEAASGPLPGSLPSSGATDQTQSAGRKRPREEARPKAGEAPASPPAGAAGDARPDPGGDAPDRMLAAMERSLELSQERMRREEARARAARVDHQIATIKAMLEESGDLMEEAERADLRRQLLALRRRSLAMAAEADGGAGG